MKVFNDHRGVFLLTDKHSYDQTFVSVSKNMYTFRGLHYQTDPYQRKTFKVIQGAVLDFIYDLNTGDVSKFILTPDSDLFTVQENFAHGFLTLTPDTIAVYGVEGEFNPDTYSSIPWHSIPEISQEVLSIVGTKTITITDKDNNGTKRTN